MRIAFAAIALLLASGVAAQPAGRDTALKLRGNVVRIEARVGDQIENGFGFIAGERAGTLYIVTARHVVIDPQDVGGANRAKVSVEFFNHQGHATPATLLGTHDVDHDLAVLTVPAPQGFHWISACEGDPTQQKVTTEVWFVGRSQGWFVPPIPGVISSDMPVNERIDVDRLSVRPGSSGGPLVASSGIIGMVLRDSAEEVQALTIGFIKEMFQRWNHPWGLEGGSQAAVPPRDALLKKLVEFLGGKQQIDSIRSLRYVAQIVSQTPLPVLTHEEDDLFQFPATRRQLFTDPVSGRWMIVVSPRAAFMTSEMGLADLSPEEREEFEAALKTNLYAMLQHCDDLNYQFVALDANTLRVTTNKVNQLWTVDPTTGRLLRVSYQDERRVEHITDYTEWKWVDGIHIAVASRWKTDEGSGGETTLTTVQVNPVVDPSLFDKPAARPFTP